MGQCWMVRGAERVGMLTGEEWKQLTSAGHRLVLQPHQQLMRGPAPGVVLVSDGAIRVVTEGDPCWQAAELEAGDIGGTHAAVPWHVEVTRPATLYLFHEPEWLALLQEAPHITRKLLSGLAWNAVQLEAQWHRPTR